MTARKLVLSVFVCLIGFILITSRASGQTANVLHHGRAQVQGGFGPFTAEVDWSTPFSDIDYAATCTIEADLGFVEGRVEIQAGSRTPSKMIVGVSEIAGNTGTVDCIGVANSSSISHGSAQVPSGFGPFTAEVDWSTPFPDTNYVAICSIEADLGFVEGRVEIEAGSRTADNMTVGVSEIAGNTGTVHCIGVANSSSISHGGALVPGGFGPFTAEVDWSTPLSGTNYIATCSIEADLGFVEGRVEIQAGTRTPSNMIVGVSELAGTSGAVYCIGVGVITFQSTLADIHDSLQLGLIDNRGIANSLSQKIIAAASAAAQGDSQAAANILQAFQSEVAAQNGAHVTSGAAQLLLQDAMALITELSQ